jgi:tetratricopeptide (TPR) repeat protein
MADAGEHIAAGKAALRSGDWHAADRAFREAVRAEAANAEAWFLLGNLAQDRGNPGEAEECLRRSVAIDPRRAEAHNSLGIVYARRQERERALACFQRAIEARPDFVHAHNNAANIAKELGRFDEALSRYREALRIQPDFADVLNNLGDLLRIRGQLEESETCCRKAVRLKPDHADSHNNLGAVFAARQRFEEAAAEFREAVRLKPGLVVARANLGWALAQLRRLDEAAAELGEVVRVAPEHAEAQKNLATVLRDLGRSDEALARCKEALRLRPDDHDSLGMLGLALTDLGQYDEALEAYAKLIALSPNRHEAHRNRALIWLVRGEFERGWTEYEWRWGCPGLPVRPFPTPLWDGSELHGRTILIHAEQGLGDTIQFIRFAPLVRERGGRVVVIAQPGLRSILAGCSGIDRFVGQDEPIPPHDLHAPLLSLPRIFGISAGSIPATVPYLSADPQRVDARRRELDAAPGLKVGMAWQGNPKHHGDIRRSFPLMKLAPIAETTGITLVSLQRGPGEHQLREAPRDWPVLNLAERPDGPREAFADVAGIIANLDMVITCDSAIAHLAGAFGVPVWIALPFSPDWRWQLDRDDSPWYPTARLFRQDRPGDWDGLFERMAAALRDRVAQSARPIMVEIAPGELIDKLTILEIKNARINDPDRLRNVQRELAVLSTAWRRSVPGSPALERLVGELRAVNEALWDVEDEIRICERNSDFGPRFVELARSVYHQNDRRAAIKRAINDLLHSRLVEEKSYAT